MILKPNMVMSGKECPKQPSVAQVAEATVTCLLRAVPAAVCGVAFLSGGQTSALASAHLNAMNVNFGHRVPWPLTFSYARAIATSPAPLAGAGRQRRNRAGRFALSREVQQRCETGKV